MKHCTKCGRKINSIDRFCANCGNNLTSNNLEKNLAEPNLIISHSSDYTPLNGGERVKITLFISFLVLSSIVYIGVIPLLIFFAANYAMKKDNKFSYIKSSLKYLKYYYTIIMIIFIVTYISGYDLDNNVMITFTGFAVAFFGYIVSSALFYKPLKIHKSWVEKNGIYGD